MAVRFGLQIPSFTFPERRDENVFEVSREIALTAEEAGFDSLWLMDHLFQIPIVAPDTDPLLDCWTGLAALAAATRSIRLGSLVTAVGFRPPSILAKITASLDVISNGRLIVGIGAGWCDWEHEGYGLGFPPVRERMERLEEAIQILQAMWTEERASFKGRHYEVRGAVNSPKPLQQPHPPLLIGGSGERVTLRLTAQYAQMHNLGAGDVAECARVLEILRQHCVRLGRDYDEIDKTRLTPVTILDDPGDLDARVESLCPAAETREGFLARTLVGTPESLIEQLRAYVDVGVDYFILSFWDVDEMEPLRRFMREVAAPLKASV